MVDDPRLAISSLRLVAAIRRTADQSSADRARHEELGRILDPSEFSSDAVPDEIVEIAVDATPVLFELWRNGETWCAAGRYNELGIVLEAHKLQPAAVALGRVFDIEPYIASRRAEISRQRGDSPERPAR